MTDKPLKTLNGKKFEGVLAEPIDHGLFMPVRLDDPAWPTYLKALELTMRSLRLAKMPALAEHLDVDNDAIELTVSSTPAPPNAFGLALFYYSIAEKLAALVVPGFQEKSRGKQPREIIRVIRNAVDALKEHGKATSDLEACRNFLKFETPDLARPGKKSELEQKAKSLRNLVAKDRASAARAEKAVHKNARLRVVK